MGAGTFVLTGPVIMLSLVLGGIAGAFVGLCDAELAAVLPFCGSSSSYI